MVGMELNLEGIMFKLSAVLPSFNAFEGMKKEWEEAAAFRHSGYRKADWQEPDTLILSGVPSRPADEVEDDGDLVSGLDCKIAVRFKGLTEFYNAFKVLCGRSLVKLEVGL